MTAYAVAYRTGGLLNCKWHRVLINFDTAETAHKQAKTLESMGYRAIVQPTSKLNHMGLPVGWRPDCVDWEHDYIEAGKFHTHHIVYPHIVYPPEEHA